MLCDESARENGESYSGTTTSSTMDVSDVPAPSLQPQPFFDLIQAMPNPASWDSIARAVLRLTDVTSDSRLPWGIAVPLIAIVSLALWVLIASGVRFFLG